MKGTLREVNEGIVFTIDEEMKVGDYRYCITRGYYCEVIPIDLEYANKHSSFHKILASTFGVGLELWIHYIGWFGEDTVSFNLFVKGWSKAISLDELLSIEHPYKIEDGKVIIEL